MKCSVCGQEMTERCRECGGPTCTVCDRVEEDPVWFLCDDCDEKMLASEDV